jgi:hypothetical protein
VISRYYDTEVTMPVVTGSDIDLKALEDQGRRLGINLEDLAGVIGVNYTTWWRWQRREAPPGRAIVVSRLQQLSELFQLLPRLFAGPDLAREWLHAARPASLGGAQTPMEVMRAGRLDRVLALLHGLASGG